MARLLPRLFVLLVLALAGGLAQAAAYNLSSGAYPPCSSNNWTVSGSTYTCNWGTVTLASGDTLVANAGVTLMAQAGIVLNGATTGSAAQPLRLATSYGTVTAGTGSRVYGDIAASSSVQLTGTQVSGAITSTSTLSISGGSVGGTIAAHSDITLTGGTYGGSIDSATGSLGVSGGQVTGNLSANGAITLGGSVAVTGNVVSRSGGITTNQASITGDLSSTCCTVRVQNTTLTGNIEVNRNDIEVLYSTVTGNLTTTNRVRLTDTVVQGNVTAATWSNDTITGTGTSRVYGTCAPAATTPSTLCQATPPVTETCFRDGFNGRSAVGGDWAATSRGGTFGMPRVVGDRLRLTDASGNVSTAATVLRLLPAANNKIRVQFKLYAYGGNGADGVALVLSDGAVTPQPGSSGGPLGYGFKTGIDGFAGGWLGVGFDEFGNFSAEGGGGSTSRTPDSIAVRGSGAGTTGYRRLAGTASLTPGVDAPNASDGPGATYRVTLDSTTAGKAVLTVERDTGSGFATLIPALDLLAASDQARLPDTFYLSLTGSTGGSTNIHEIDDFEICANRINAVEQPIDHFEFVTASGATTCAPQAVTVTACTNASSAGAPQACQPYAGNVAITLSSSGWVGGNSKTLVNGTGTFYLQGLQTSMPLGYSAATPAAKPLSQSLCKIGSGAWSTSCQLSFAQGGFLFDVPTLTAGREQAAIPIRAVVNKGSATSPKCEPAFVNVDRAVGFWSDYIDPAPAAVSTQASVSLNGQALSRSASAPTAVALRFDGQGQASLRVSYPEAGRVQLNAHYAGSTGSGDSGSMVGSDQFVAVPAGFCVAPTASCTAGDASCARFRRAGEAFPVRFRAVAWQADGDTDLCTGNATTTNYRQTGLVLAPQLLAPAGGDPGRVLQPASARYDHLAPASPAGWNGEIAQDVAFSEVGVFRLQVAPPTAGYLGETVPASVSAPIGRIVPALLEVTGAARLAPSCGLYSYQDQPIGFAADEAPTLSVVAYGQAADGSRFITRNYDRPGFWRLGSAFDWRLLSLDANGTPSAVNRAYTLGQGSFALLQQAGLDVEGDGVRRYRLAETPVAYARQASPGDADLPFEARLRLALSAASFTDSDGVCRAQGTGCLGYDLDFGGSQVRLGRLRIGNAHGSELQPLDLPWLVESWQGAPGNSGFREETADRCSAAALGQPVLGEPTGNLRRASLEAAVLARGEHAGVLRLSAPGAGHDGSVTAGFALDGQRWLDFDWLGRGERTAAQGQASFGIFNVPRPLIFRRETYR